MKYLKYLLIFVFISMLCKIFAASASMIFLTSALAIIPLAGLMGRATEEISVYTGPKIGGLLNATFGNATELIIAIFALQAGLFDVVKASIAGSVIGNILLVLGASMFFGGLKHKIQKFNKNSIELSSSMLLFAVIGLTIPAIFMHTVDPTIRNTSNYEWVSVAVSFLLFLTYIGGLYFSFYIHKDLYGSDHVESAQAKWSLKKSILVLVFATLAIALESEFLVSSVEKTTETLHISKFFVGIILIPIIGNAAEHSTAIIMAMKNKMDIAIEIAIGSSLQIIMFVAPVLIFISLLFKPMDIIFSEFELNSLIVAVLIANRVSSDGESNWLEGFQLIGVYVIIAITFLIV